MRIFAALGVMQYHLWHNYFSVEIGHPGTDFFLVLVGVVAAYNQAKQIPNGSWWKYIKDRYIRLYVTFVPLFVLAVLAKWSEVDLEWIFKSFVFLPMAERAPIIGSTWMLSMFLLFYFVFSLCFLVRTEKVIWGIFGLWLAAIFIRNAGIWNFGLPIEWSHLLLSERNINFMLGYTVGVILRSDRLQTYWARISFWIGLTGVIAGTFLLNAGFTANGRTLILGLPIALFLLGVATLEQKNVDDPIVKFLTLPAVVWLGGTSYVLYLSHSIFLHAWSLVLPITVIWVIPITLAAIFVAALGYAFWEGPVLLYLKNRRWVIPQLPTLHVSPERQTQK